MTKKLIIDCDPGHDDAIALFLAFGDPAVEVAAVTTVRGNQSIEHVANNALILCDIAEQHAIPVAAGAHRPLVHDPLPDLGIHGRTGLDGPDLPEPSRALDPRHAVQLMIDTIMAAPAGEITLVALGPLTNLALAVRLEPRIVERVAGVVTMGGGFHVGNRTPVAEFNVLSDPEAAHIVYEAGWPVTIIGLDVTNTTTASPDVLGRIEAIDTPVARFVVELLAFYAKSYEGYEGMAGAFTAPPVHDACAVAYAIAPELFDVVPAPVTVELTGSRTRGMTVADLRAPAPEGCRTRIARSTDARGVWGLIERALASGGASAP
ncbi:nucleoside hydrolase [Agromyces aerolatus]|uniref:nucleoside hydrolase n=1 Tax=Agromyces sp. LY-1074 TaxID=3074080 RepID=UPI00285544F9|nr:MULTISPECIES: nucleoside hydrolase [unclassified Agromyces]MDR5700436.1 nucleoside hydrolase [Agromyces sp. LY-1074]MDR5706957.1 nucleoside hydrolase [Agromyces sp. LY-1358]